MPLLLDTSVAVDVIDDVAGTLDRAREADALYLSVISHVELEAGVHRDRELGSLFRTRLDRFLTRVVELDFTSREVAAYAAIIAAKGFSRRLIVDRMIAATALANGLTLATLNPRDFRDVPGLEVEDWSS
ncbi:MAG: PIN domain-containing protein [Pseudomonadota bacterium]|nr:PIN domain-containing protein [Pseudomonadota bacterium]